MQGHLATCGQKADGSLPRQRWDGNDREKVPEFGRQGSLSKVFQEKKHLRVRQELMGNGPVKRLKCSIFK